MKVLHQAVGVVLVALAAGPAYATLVAASAATFQPVSMEFGEATIYGATLRIVQGQPLYQPYDMPPYTIVGYTPLYYYAAAALRASFGEGFGPGRVLSLVAGLCTAVLIAILAARTARAVWAGVLAALLFLALAFPGGTPWISLYRVDMLGVALSVGAVVLLHTRRSIVVAGVFAGLALLTKQTFVAALLAGTFWLWPDRRRAATFVASAGLTFLAPCLVLDITTNGAFVQDTLVTNVNPFDLDLARGLFAQLLEAQWLPLLSAAAYLVTGRKDRLVVLYWVASSLQLIGMAKVGANHNYWIEFAAATAILAANGIACMLRLPRPAIATATTVGIVGLFGAVLGQGAVHTAVGGLGAVRTTLTEVSFQMAMLRAGSHDPDFDALVTRVKAQPGFVLADPPDVVVLADRPVMFEPLIYSFLMAEGRWQADPAVRMICDGEVSLVVLDYPLDAQDNTAFGAFHAWPDPVFTALEDAMQPSGQLDNRDLYTPRSHPGGVCSST